MCLSNSVSMCIEVFLETLGVDFLLCFVDLSDLRLKRRLLYANQTCQKPNKMEMTFYTKNMPITYEIKDTFRNDFQPNTHTQTKKVPIIIRKRNFNMFVRFLFFVES